MFQLFSLLKKLELGVFFFCWRCALEAEKEGLIVLAKQLRHQAESEYAHAQILAYLTGGKLEMTAHALFDREYKQSQQWSTFVWDKQETAQVDGMSTKYITAKIFFGGRTANSYDWADKLAFMQVLEQFQTGFYRVLIKFSSASAIDKLKLILDDEQEHANDLAIILINSSGEYKASLLIKKWQVRLLVSIPFILVDLLILIPFSIFSHFIKPLSIFNGKNR